MRWAVCPHPLASLTEDLLLERAKLGAKRRRSSSPPLLLAGRGRLHL